MYKQYFRKHIQGYWNIIKSYSQNTPQCLMLFAFVSSHRSAKISSKSLDCLPSHSQVISANNRLVIKWAILRYVFFHIGQRFFFYSYATLFGLLFLPREVFLFDLQLCIGSNVFAHGHRPLMVIGRSEFSKCRTIFYDSQIDY